MRISCGISACRLDVLGFIPFGFENCLPSGGNLRLRPPRYPCSDPTDIGWPPYWVGLCTRSVYGLADALRRWWNRLDKFLISLGIQPTRADWCTYVCYDGAFKEPSKVAEATEPSPVTFYVSSQQGEVTQHESSDIAEEVHKSLLVEERLFSACYQQPQTWKQRTEFKQKKVEDCAWTPVVD